MRILYIYKSLYQKGGLERVIIEQMNLFRNRGNEIFIITTEQDNRPFPYKIDNLVHQIDLGIKSHHQSDFSFLKRIYKKLFNEFKIKAKLIDTIAEIKPDIIIGISIGLADIIQDVRGNIPYIVQCHVPKERTWCLKNGIIGFDKLKFHIYLHKMKQCDALVVLTNTDAEIWGNDYRTVVIPNIVHLNPNNTIVTGNEKKIIFVGRIHDDKGLPYLLDVWDIVHTKYPDWHLAIFGTGDEKDVSILQQKISIREKISYEGVTNDIFKEYLSSSIHVLTSKRESFGLVIAEAMSCGLPSVSFDSPYGPREIIQNGVDGFLVPLGNVDEMANKICYLIEHDEVRKHMGQKAIHNIQRFSADFIVPMWINLFNNLVNQQKG